MDDTLPYLLRARALAREHCEDCAWYHGTWPLLRAVGLGSTAGLHASLYAAGLGDHPAERVLVTGAADPAMLEVVEVLCTSLRELVVVDRCETPLALARDWGDGRCFELAAARRDARDLDGLGTFDALFTHAFLGYFTPAQRRDLVAAWRRALVPGGRLITVNRLRPGAPDVWQRAAPEAARALREEVRRRAEALPLDAEDVDRALDTWTDRMGAWPLRDADEVVALLEPAGFSVEVTLHGDAGGQPAPGSVGGACFALIVGTAR